MVTEQSRAKCKASRHGTLLPGISRDDVGQQIVLDHRDLVLQPQLALLEPGDLQLVGRSGRQSAHRSPRRDRGARCAGAPAACAVPARSPVPRPPIAEIRLVARETAARRIRGSSGVRKARMMWFDHNHAARTAKGTSCLSGPPERRHRCCHRPTPTLSKPSMPGSSARLHDEMSRPVPDTATIQQLKKAEAAHQGRAERPLIGPRYPFVPR